jgi:hypothetical protein
VVIDQGGIAAVVVRSQGDLVTVPWRSVRRDVPASSTRVMSTMLLSRPDSVPRREERFATLEARPGPTVVVPVAPGTVGRAALLAPQPLYRLDSLYDRGILMSTPTDRPSDLLKDRFEAHRAPPARPFLAPVTTLFPPPRHSSVR